MGDVKDGCPKLPEQERHFGSHLHPELDIQIAERLIHQENIRLCDQCPGDRDSLLLTAGKLRRIPFFQSLQMQEL